MCAPGTTATSMSAADSRPIRSCSTSRSPISSGPLPEDLTDSTTSTCASSKLSKQARTCGCATAPRRSRPSTTSRIASRTANGTSRDVDVSYRRQQAHLLDAHAADPGRRRIASSRSGTIWEYDRTTDTLHRVIAVRHRRGRRPRRRASLPAGRPHRLLVHAPAPVEGRADRRGQAPVLGPGRRPERARLRAARHECGRQRHPPDLVQPEPRPRPRRCSTDGRIVFSRWENASGSSHSSVYGEPGRQRPAAPVRREQPRDRHRRGRARPGGSWRDRRAVPAAAPAAGRPRVALLQPVPAIPNTAATRCDRHRRTSSRTTQADLDNPGPPGPAQSRACPSTTCAPIPAPRRAGATASVFPLWDGTDRLLDDLDPVPAARHRRPHPALHAANLAGCDPDPCGAAAVRRLDLRSARRHAAAGAAADRGRPLLGGRAAGASRAAARRDPRRGSGRRLRPDARDRERRHPEHPQRLRPRRR